MTVEATESFGSELLVFSGITGAFIPPMTIHTASVIHWRTLLTPSAPKNFRPGKTVFWGRIPYLKG